jgi:hypothetical protein
MGKKLYRSHTGMCSLCGRRVGKQFISHPGDPIKTAHYTDRFANHTNTLTGMKCSNSGKCVTKEGESTQTPPSKTDPAC